jgi:RimJ/RimL family protein N-acetyltransferase
LTSVSAPGNQFVQELIGITAITMQHSVTAEGWGVRLRPVRLEDADFIVWLRNLAHARGKVGDSAPDRTAQEGWLRAYFERPGDYYFIIETVAGTPVGAYGIYDVRDDSAESGRWVIRPEVPAAIPSAMLAFDTAFSRLNLKELRVKTVSSNRNVLSLNSKLGFRQTRVETAAQIIAGQPVDMVHFLLQASEWPPRRTKLLPLADLAERQVRDWEALQPQNVQA